MTPIVLRKDDLEAFYKKFILGKKAGDKVKLRLLIIGYTQLKQIRPIYISTRALKHITEKRPDFTSTVLLKGLHKILSRPERIYQNNKARSTGYLYVRGEGDVVLAVLEIREGKAYVVTSFESNEKYLKRFELIWNGRTANPSSQDG